MTHHFILKDNGLLYWVKDMPEYPNKSHFVEMHDDVNQTFHEKEYTAAKLAYQSAIDSAIEVSNQNDVKTKLYMIEYYGGRTLEHITDYKFKVGQIYSLECSVEKKITTQSLSVEDYQRPENQNRDVSIVGYIKTVALVTFESVENPSIDWSRGNCKNKFEVIESVEKETQEIPEDVWLDYGRDELGYSFEAAEKKIPNPVDYVRKKMSKKYMITRK